MSTISEPQDCLKDLWSKHLFLTFRIPEECTNQLAWSDLVYIHPFICWHSLKVHSTKKRSQNFTIQPPQLFSIWTDHVTVSSAPEPWLFLWRHYMVAYALWSDFIIVFYWYFSGNYPIKLHAQVDQYPNYLWSEFLGDVSQGLPAKVQRKNVWFPVSQMTMSIKIYVYSG